MFCVFKWPRKFVIEFAHYNPLHLLAMAVIVVTLIKGELSQCQCRSFIYLSIFRILFLSASLGFSISSSNGIGFIPCCRAMGNHHISRRRTNCECQQEKGQLNVALFNRY
jgi:hypothetical protein